MRTNQYPIGHCDADAFYVSAERVRYPELSRMPVGVLGNQGACVIAKSYEMKSQGVKTGDPIWDALRKSPDGLYIKRDFRWYEILSRLMLDVVRELSPIVEYYSVDEFFFEAVPPKGMDYLDYARKIRDEILDRHGLPVTVGIARTRTLAKLISDTGKPFGAVAVLGEEQERKVLAKLGVAEVTGIAGRREKLLMPWGIRTCLDLADAERGLVRELLTATGEALWWELRGDPVLPLHPQRPLHKVLSRGGSFGGSTSDPVILYAWLVRNLERLIEELEFHEVRASRIAVVIEYKGDLKGYARASLESPSDRFDVLLDVFRPCLRKAWIPRAQATRMHLFAEHLRPRTPAQVGLFEGPGDMTRRAEAVARLKREINQRHGRFKLRSAATLPLAGVYRDSATEYDICDIRGKSCF